MQLFLTSLFLIFETTLLMKPCVAGNAERRLHTHLLEGYNRMARPVIKERNPVDVQLGMALQQIIDVNWSDENMVWDPEKYNGLKEIRMKSSDVWTPDILLYNSLTENFNPMYQTSIIVRSDGTMEWMPPGIIKSTCKINIRYFPFDEQECTLKFGSWTHHGRLLNLTVGDVTTDDYTVNGEWHLSNVKAELNTFYYECCPEPYLDVKFHIFIKRKTLYYGFNLIIPCILIAFMVLLDFVLPPDCNEKLSLGITIFMSLVVFLIMVGNVTPSTSDALPLLGIFFVAIMMIVSCSLVFTILVLNFHYRDPSMDIMPKPFRTLFLYWLPKLLWMSAPPDLLNYRANGEPAQSSSSSRPFHVPEEPRGGDGMDVLKMVHQVTSHLHGIDRDLKTMTSEIRRKDAESKTGSEWRFAARVLDRLCLIMFLCIFTTVSIVVFTRAPHISVPLEDHADKARRLASAVATTGGQKS